jgi:DNA-directed RNA polymerase specialized sigma24 family protein
MAACQHWLATASHAVPDDQELTGELDASLSARALLARHDAAERDALLFSLAGKVQCFATRFRRWNLAPWTYDDVLQESYLAFVETLDAWRPIVVDGRPTGFGRYFLRTFPYRLTDRVRRMLGVGRGRAPVGALPRDIDEWPDPFAFEPHLHTLVLLDTVRERLTDRDGLIVYLRVLADATPEQIAVRVAASERTVRRRWSRITPLLRERLAG